MNFVILIISLAIIVFAADKLIDSSSKIARFYGVPVFIIDVSIIAFGTSAPELVVGIISSIQGANELSYGNIIGSCINNTGLILGISAMLLTIKVDEKILKKEMLMLTVIEFILLFMSFNGVLSRFNGIILLLMGIAFILYIVKGSKNPEQMYIDEDMKIEKKDLSKNWIVMVLSLLGLVVSGHLIVESSQAIAESFHIDKSAIGLTLIALGTTMPELVTSIAAARRKEDDIVLGNIIGSNIFNILLILGSASIINPIPINFIDNVLLLKSLVVDVGFMIFLNLFLYAVMFAKRRVSKRTGIIICLLYVLYMTKQIYFMI